MNTQKKVSLSFLWRFSGSIAHNDITFSWVHLFLLTLGRNRLNRQPTCTLKYTFGQLFYYELFWAPVIKTACSLKQINRPQTMPEPKVWRRRNEECIIVHNYSTAKGDYGGRKKFWGNYYWKRSQIASNAPMLGIQPHLDTNEEKKKQVPAKDLRITCI